MLYSENMSMFLLGCLANDPSLIRGGKYPLDKNDFSPNVFHYHLYAVINNLALQGVEEITEIDIDQFIQPYEATKEIIYDNDGLMFIRKIKELSNAGNIDLYYNVVRKLALLRDAQDTGIDIGDIVNSAMSIEQIIETINKHSLEDILAILDTKFIQLRKKFRVNNIRAEMWAGTDFEKVLESFEQEPAFGAGFASSYETSILRGWQRGHLIMRSASSGYGKSTRAVADLCMVCCKELYDENLKAFVKNPNYQGKGFFIHSEMEQTFELQPKFISFISNIPTHKIMDGDYTPEEKERLLKSAEILKDSGIKLVDMPDFTLPLIGETIREMAMTHGCVYGVFDYVQNNGVVSKQIKSENGTALREDMVLLQITAKLKALAEEYNIGLLTMSQLNGKEKEAMVIDESCLAGAKSMKNKLDGGWIMMYPTKKELEQTQSISGKRGFGTDEINCVSHLYKGRFSKYGQNLKVFQIFNRDTGRIQDCFVTTWDNTPISVDKVMIKGVE